MQMEYKSSKELANETIIYAGEMEPMDRNEFIDLTTRSKIKFWIF